MIHVRILWKSKKNEDTHFSLSGANPSRIVINLTGANLINSIFFNLRLQNCESTTKDPAPFDGFTLIRF